MTIRHLLGLVIVAMLGWPGAAQAEPTLPVSIQHLINPDGTGFLFASASGGGQVNWEACPPGEPCKSVPSRPDPAPTQTLGGALDVGDAAADTVFVATATNGSQTGSARTSPYLGRVHSITPPSISGKLRVGALVKPVAGTWSGGWGGEQSYLQTQVCRFANGTGCVVVADDFYWDKCPGAGAVLTFNQVGRYVRVIDWRIGRDTVFAAIGIPLDRIEPMQPSPARAATIAGPIASARWQPESACGLPPPRVKLSTRAVRRGRRLEIGRVGCLLRCQVIVRLETCKLKAGVSGCRALRPGERKVRIHFTRTFPGGPDSGVLMVPYRHTRRIGPGTFAVNVALPGEFGVSGLVRVPRWGAKSTS